MHKINHSVRVITRELAFLCRDVWYKDQQEIYLIVIVIVIESVAIKK